MNPGLQGFMKQWAGLGPNESLATMFYGVDVMATYYNTLDNIRSYFCECWI